MSGRDLAGRIVGHYEHHALDWDADRQAIGWNDKPWHDRFIDALPDGATVLDLGCGSGAPIALDMAARGLRVTGVDASPTLISLCRRRMPDQEWIVQDMRSLSLGRTFDGVLAWDSFFHLHADDQRRMFEIFTAHAATPAVLMFNAGPVRGEVIGRYRGDPLYHASLDASEYETLLRQSGFSIIAHAVEDRLAGGRDGLAGRRPFIELKVTCGSNANVSSTVHRLSVGKSHVTGRSRETHLERRRDIAWRAAPLLAAQAGDRFEKV